MTTRILRLSGLCLALTAAPARAHDFWIAPGTFHPQAGTALDLFLRVGHGLDVTPVQRLDDRTEEFVAAAPDGSRQAIANTARADLAGTVRIQAPGTWVFGYHGRPVPSILPAPRFEAYLREEALDHVLAARRAAGRETRPGFELYARCAKSLVLTGNAVELRDQDLGFPLEFIAEAQRRPAPGDPIRVRLECDDRPAPGVRVELMQLDGGATGREVVGVSVHKTDAAGCVAVALPSAGSFLLSAIVMEAAPPGQRADWISRWASLAFAVPAPDGATITGPAHGEPR